ncbi:DUF4138 domain-containing protein [Salegentibacter maritimus]|uniref:DUF4138 domain-containing protein n=1 Tax=Salegentibacter maritimus TaxID=2794347 RepID=A0ABS0TEZ2_9FLAO|nr:DUF4138 domain-containing protein [Salegentibacter maritimus]MBI6119625.1 DUF4138 domain-containing protein [Salegentibacter maritimus]
MKKQVLIIALMIVGAIDLIAQQNLDTIYANDKMNVALVFPDPIRQGITGSENFVFTYNRELEQNLGLLQAVPGEESNLLVISSKGSIFSYIVKYSEELEKINYFIADSSKIGYEFSRINEENRASEKVYSELPTEKELEDKNNQYRDLSANLLGSEQSIGEHRKRKNGIELNVENLVFNGSELYFVFEIINNSSIDYEPAYLDIFVETRKQGKKKSIQKLPVIPVYKYLKPEIIRQNRSRRFVYVLPKFSIAEDKVVRVDLKEQNGERDIKLKLKHKVINHPN